MATPCRVAFFVCADATPPREQGGGGRDNHHTYPRKGESDQTPPATTQQHLPATRDHATALASNPQILQQRKKYCEKCCSFKKISYFCSLKANRKIVKMRCKTTHFLMLAPATAWVGIFTS